MSDDRFSMDIVNLTHNVPMHREQLASGIWQIFNWRKQPFHTMRHNEFLEFIIFHFAL